MILVQLARCRQTAGEPDAEEEPAATPSDVRFADCLYESLTQLARRRVLMANERQPDTKETTTMDYARC